MTYLYVFIAVLAAIVVAGYLLRWTWTGLRVPEDRDPHAKTLWDWMALLIVPMVLAAGAYGINGAQKTRDEKREAARAKQQDKIALDQRRAETLRIYLQQMTGLVADHDLATKDDPSVEGLATSLTTGVLRQLDGDGRRKGEVVQFLTDAKLIRADGEDLVIDPYALDLRGANLRGAYLVNAYLSKADLTGADFHRAILDGATFDESNLTDADFSEAYLVGDEEYDQLDFIDTCLTGARFTGAELPEASFRGAEGRDVDFSGADLDETDFRGARLWGVQDDGATYVDAHRQKERENPSGKPCEDIITANP